MKQRTKKERIRSRPSREPKSLSRLEFFIRANDVKPAQLARVACISRQHLQRIRDGVAEPTRHVMVRLLMASILILRRRLRMSDLFDLTDTGL